MARYLEVTLLTYTDGWKINLLDGTPTKSPPKPDGFESGDWKVDDIENKGWVSLYDLKYDPADNLPPPPDAGSYTFVMRLRFNENAPNTVQGATFNLTVEFTLNQDSIQ